MGTVGSGKSTQIKLLASALKVRRLKVKITFLKRGHLLAYFLEVFLAKIILGTKSDCSIRSIVEQRPVLFKKLFKLFLFLDIVSIFYRFLLTIYLPKKLGYIILVEEYVQAAIADYIALAEFVHFNMKGLLPPIKLFSGLAHLAGPFQTFFLDAPNSTLRSRWVERKSPDQRSDYLSMQRTLLFSISKKLSSSLFYINTSDKSVEKTGVIIINIFNQLQR